MSWSSSNIRTRLTSWNKLELFLPPPFSEKFCVMMTGRNNKRNYMGLEFSLWEDNNFNCIHSIWSYSDFVSSCGSSTDFYFPNFPIFLPLCSATSLSLSAKSVSYKTNFFIFIQLMLKNIILITECLIYSWACTIPGIICHFFNKTWFTSGTSIFL